ncbi:MAG: filamentous hemagglutinin N-terminal domain-containing protein [Rhabdochlamydiaceae bacterium]|nr:filamentous hemagglutinin N-terminal domain-containing protein [Rhabdochlamydiaceae bacterium]
MRIKALVIAATLTATGLLLANPSHPVVISGTVTIDDATPGSLTLYCEDAKTIIEWDSFSIDTAESTYFQMSDPSFAVLNRVTGGSADIVLGNLHANGDLFLINSEGLTITGEATIGASRIVLSSLDVSDTDFLSHHNMQFFGKEASVVNYGSITSDNSHVQLLGFHVENAGVISANAGTISIAAAQHVILNSINHPTLEILSQGGSQNAVTGIDQKGTLNAIRHSLQADGSLYTTGILQQGTIIATGSNSHQSSIRLESVSGSTTVSGMMRASNANSTGGVIQVLGKNLNINDGAVMDCSGASGGGMLFIGGGFNGSFPTMMNAENTTVAAGALIRTNAIYFGDAGPVTLFASDTTSFYGTIHATGGHYQGNGGRVQIFGGRTLNYSGTVDNSAMNGEQGELLFDQSQ